VSIQLAKPSPPLDNLAKLSLLVPLLLLVTVWTPLFSRSHSLVLDHQTRLAPIPVHLVLVKLAAVMLLPTTSVVTHATLVPPTMVPALTTAVA